MQHNNMIYYDRFIKRAIIKNNNKLIYNILVKKYNNDTIKFFYREYLTKNKWIRFLVYYPTYCKYCIKRYGNQLAHMQKGGCMSSKPRINKYKWSKLQRIILLKNIDQDKLGFIIKELSNFS